MAYQAIITFLLALLVPSLFISTGYDGTDYRTILYIFTCHVMADGISILPRPDGFFWEPGVFQLYLNIYLYLCLFIFKNKWQTIIAVIAILTTQSTTGIVLCLILISYYVVREYINKGSLIARFGNFFVSVIILIPLIILASGNIEDKFYGDNKGSSWAREYDLMTGINVVVENPLIGIGFDYGYYYKISRTLGYRDTFLDNEATTDRGNSNGIIFLLYSTGIPLSILFIIGLFKQTFLNHKFLIGLLLLISCSSESLIFTPFFLIFIYSGLANLAFKKKTKTIATIPF